MDEKVSKNKFEGHTQIYLLRMLFYFFYLIMAFLGTGIVIVTGNGIIIRYCIEIILVLGVLQRIVVLVYGCVLKMW